MGKNDKKTIALGLPQKTMFKQILEMGLDYGVYFSDGPTTLQMKDMRRLRSLKRHHYIEKLYKDLADGNLPDLTWVEPSYFNGPEDHHKATDQHPDHDVSLGEKLIKNVYEALRSSPLWNETALIITYDEHGGFYDHVVPPMNVPNPDGRNSTEDPFDFTRLGVRIPTILVSPWVKKGSVYHAANTKANNNTNINATGPGTGSYEHSSLMSTILHKMFTPKKGFNAPQYLTKRDYWAATFENVFDEINQPRTDCLLTLPDIWNGSTTVLTLDGSRLISDLQLEIIAIIAGTVNDVETLNHIHSGFLRQKWTEAIGRNYIQEKMKLLMDISQNELLSYPDMYMESK